MVSTQKSNLKLLTTNQLIHGAISIMDNAPNTPESGWASLVEKQILVNAELRAQLEIANQGNQELMQKLAAQNAAPVATGITAHQPAPAPPPPPSRIHSKSQNTQSPSSRQALNAEFDEVVQGMRQQERRR
jgi:hypothetical protein